MSASMACLIGRGEVVLVNAEKLGLRFVEVVNQADASKAIGLRIGMDA